MQQGTLKHVPKRGTYAFEKIRQEREDADWSGRTKEWIHDIPADNGSDGKHTTLTEILNDRSQKRKISGSAAMQRKAKRVVSSSHHLENVWQDLPAKDDQYTQPEVAGGRRATRATQRQRQQAEKPQGLANADSQSALENVSDYLVFDNFIIPTRQQYSEAGRASTPLRQPSPSKNTSEFTRSSSPSKKSTRIETDRLGFYEPKSASCPTPLQRMRDF
jgi:hypothetical protein